MSLRSVRLNVLLPKIRRGNSNPWQETYLLGQIHKKYLLKSQRRVLRTLSPSLRRSKIHRSLPQRGMSAVRRRWVKRAQFFLLFCASLPKVVGRLVSATVGRRSTLPVCERVCSSEETISLIYLPHISPSGLQFENCSRISVYNDDPASTLGPGVPQSELQPLVFGLGTKF